MTFDRDMDEGMSWTGGGAIFPPAPDGERAAWRDRRTCVLPVRLAEGHYYRVGINSLSYQNFRSVEGVPANAAEIAFTTRGAGADLRAKLPPPISPALAEAAFDQLWKAFDEHYAMFTLRPEVNWDQLRERYRPKALASKSTCELAEVCAEMLRPLRDLHVWLKVAGANIPVFSRPRTANANPAAAAAILGNMHEAGRVRWALTEDKIGYIAIYEWSGDSLPEQCAEALEQAREARGLIVDVRLNGGGSEPLAAEFAGRFLKKDFVYAHSQFRNGPRHSDLTAKIARKISPRGPWRYDRPVLLLIGQQSMSSNESFVGMMMGDPQVVTMGDRTCGSSGNPRFFELPLGLSVSVPQWIDYRPDGKALDERGFEPQILFKAEPDAFTGERDDLLSAALARLRAGH